MQIPDIKNLSREELISIVEMLLKRVVELENGYTTNELRTLF